jgi:hypothetical protein
VVIPSNINDLAVTVIGNGDDYPFAASGVTSLTIAGARPGGAFDDDLMAALDQLVNGGRQQCDAMFLQLNFPGNADNHGAMLLRLPQIYTDFHGFQRLFFLMTGVEHLPQGSPSCMVGRTPSTSGLFS